MITMQNMVVTTTQLHAHYIHMRKEITRSMAKVVKVTKYNT